MYHWRLIPHFGFKLLILLFIFWTNATALGQFKRLSVVPSQETIPVSLQLASHPQLKKVKVEVKSQLVKSRSRNGIKEFPYEFVDVWFHQVGPQEFYALRQKFGGLSQIPYRLGTSSYHLIEFLPPKMQALYGLKFESHSKIRTNCWGTAYEMLRHPQAPLTLFYAPPFEINQVLRSPAYTYPVAMSPQWMESHRMQSQIHEDVTRYRHKHLSEIQEQFKKTPQFNLGYDTLPDLWVDFIDDAQFNEFDLTKEANLKFGDLLLVSQEGLPEVTSYKRKTLHSSLMPFTLVHAAIYLGGNLFFEKTALNSSAPYRFATFETIQKTYGQRYSHGTVYEFRRARKGFLFPAPEEIFFDGKAREGMDYDKVSLKISPTGRGFLAAKSVP